MYININIYIRVICTAMYIRIFVVIWLQHIDNLYVLKFEVYQEQKITCILLVLYTDVHF